LERGTASFEHFYLLNVNCVILDRGIDIDIYIDRGYKLRLKENLNVIILNASLIFIFTPTFPKIPDIVSAQKTIIVQNTLTTLV